MHSRESAEVLRLSVELERDGADPLAGRVAGRGTAERPFSGWLGLIAALENVIRPELDEETSGAT